MRRIVTAAAVWARGFVTPGVHYLLLHVTPSCNASCRMCFTWEHMVDRRGARGPTLEAYERLATTAGLVPQVTVSGGEPLLRDDLAAILTAFHHRAGTRFFTVPTNALLPERVEALIGALTAACPGAYLNFCLPFHGDEAAFAEAMGVAGAHDRFRETLDVILAARRGNDAVSCLLNHVLTADSCGDHRAIIDRAVAAAPDVPVGLALCRGAPREPQTLHVPVASYEAARRYLAERTSDRSGFNPYSVMFEVMGDQIGTVVSEVLRGECRDLGCGAGRDLLVVSDDGTVHPCELLGVVGMPPARNGEGQPPEPADLGNLYAFDFDLRALLASDHARDVVRWIRTHPCACTWESAIYGALVHSPIGLARTGLRAARNLLRRRGDR